MPIASPPGAKPPKNFVGNPDDHGNKQHGRPMREHKSSHYSGKAKPEPKANSSYPHKKPRPA